MNGGPHPRNLIGEEGSAPMQSCHAPTLARAPGKPERRTSPGTSSSRWGLPPSRSGTPGSRRQRFAPGGWLLLFAVLAVAPARAAAQHWARYRHDSYRRALQAQPSRLAVPALRASLPLGSAPDAMGWTVLAPSPTDPPWVFVLRGGRVLAYTADGTLRWATEPLGVAQILGLLDLDGDGQPELYAQAPDLGLYALSMEDGSVSWSLVLDGRGRLSEVWPFDADGDGRLELYVDTKGCLVWTEGQGQVLFFDEGLPPRGVPLDTTGYTFWCGIGHAAVDLEGDGTRDVVAFDDRRIVGHDPATGAARWAVLLEDRLPRAFTRAAAVDLDGDGRQELLVWTLRTFAFGEPVQVLLLARDEDGGEVELRWRLEFPEGTELNVPTPAAADLLPAPGQQIVLNVFDPASGSWQVRIYDGKGTGPRLLLTLPRRYAHALTGGPVAGVLVSAVPGRYVPPFSRLQWLRRDEDAGEPTAAWQHPSAAPLLEPEAVWRDRARGWSLVGDRFVAVDVDGDQRGDEVRSLRNGFRYAGAAPLVGARQVLGSEAVALVVAASDGTLAAVGPDGTLAYESFEEPGTPPLREFCCWCPRWWSWAARRRHSSWRTPPGRWWRSIPSRARRGGARTGSCSAPSCSRWGTRLTWRAAAKRSSPTTPGSPTAR